MLAASSYFRFVLLLEPKNAIVPLRRIFEKADPARFLEHTEVHFSNIFFELLVIFNFKNSEEQCPEFC